MDFPSGSSGGLLGAPFFDVLRKRKRFKKQAMVERDLQ
jgi:hypothetical protein